MASATRHPPLLTVVAGAGDSLTLESARLASEHGIITPLLIGDKETILGTLDAIGWAVDEKQIYHAEGEQETANLACELAGKGTAQAIMKGHIHTDALLRAVLNRDFGLRTEKRLSHVFHMTFPESEKSVLITDAVLNVAPNEEMLTTIIENGVFLAHKIGIDQPKVALLSASESVMSAMPSSEIAHKLSQQPYQNAMVFGPLALDNAISPDAARIKGIENPVAGNADVLVVPNIESGNILFKAMVYLCSAVAGGIVLGAKVPVMLTSRADPKEARLASSLLASMVVNNTP